MSSVENRVSMLMLCALALGCTPTAPSADLKLPVTAPRSAPLEAFFLSTSLDDPKRSPTDRFVAGLRTLGACRNLVKIDLETGKTWPITVFDNDTLESFEWASDERLLLSRAFKGGFIRKLFAIDADRQNLFDFLARENARDELAPSARPQFGDQTLSVLSADPNNVLPRESSVSSARTTSTARTGSIPSGEALPNRSMHARRENNGTDFGLLAGGVGGEGAEYFGNVGDCSQSCCAETGARVGFPTFVTGNFSATRDLLLSPGRHPVRLIGSCVPLDPNSTASLFNFTYDDGQGTRAISFRDGAIEVR